MLISRGAEAELFLKGDAILKKRMPKKYRHPKLDLMLRLSRTRREAKVIEKLPREIDRPVLLKVDEKNMTLEMSYIKGDKVRDILGKNIKICYDIGKKIALMHNAGIIHGDLTTSNMILSGRNVYFIDFGLSFFSHKAEDKAVDLHLLRQALESRHHRVFKKAFALALEGYTEKTETAGEILKRLEKVELRGRNKGKF